MINAKIRRNPPLLKKTQKARAAGSNPAKKSPNNSGQHQPQGHTGTLSTDSTKGSPPSSPQGDTPSDMQAKPKGKDKGETK